MNPDDLIPFAYEVIWFSLGGGALYLDEVVHLGFAALLIFGGMVGSVARNADTTHDTEDIVNE